MTHPHLHRLQALTGHLQPHACSASAPPAHPIQSFHGKEYFIDKEEHPNPHIQPQRINVFTEEYQQISVSSLFTSSYSKVTAMIVLSDGSICLRINDPVTLVCYTAYSQYHHYYKVDLTEHFPIYESIGSSLQMCALPDNQLLLFSPTQQLLVLTSMPSQSPNKDNTMQFVANQRGEGKLQLAKVTQKSSVTCCQLPSTALQIERSATTSTRSTRPAIEMVASHSHQGIVYFYTLNTSYIYILHTDEVCKDHSSRPGPVIHMVDGVPVQEWQHSNFVGNWYTVKLQQPIQSMLVLNERPYYEFQCSHSSKRFCVNCDLLQLVQQHDVLPWQEVLTSQQSPVTYTAAHQFTVATKPAANTKPTSQSSALTRRQPPAKSEPRTTNSRHRIPRHLHRGKPAPSCVDDDTNAQHAGIPSIQPPRLHNSVTIYTPHMSVNNFNPTDKAQPTTLLHFQLHHPSSVHPHSSPTKQPTTYSITLNATRDTLLSPFNFNLSLATPLYHTSQIAIPCYRLTDLQHADNINYQQQCIAVIDLATSTIRYIRINTVQFEHHINIEKLSAHNANSGVQPLQYHHAPQVIAMCEVHGSGDLITTDTLGNVKFYEVSDDALSESSRNWRALFGEAAAEGEQSVLSAAINGKLLSQLEKSKQASDEKGVGDGGGGGEGEGEGEGKGSGTAGKGGSGSSSSPERNNAKGGTPTRERAANVTDEAREAAQALSQQELANRLLQLDLQSDDNTLYEQYLERVRKQINQLRLVLEAAEAKAHERTWLRNQNQGDLDDSKLIDAMLNEKNVFRRRGDQPPEAGTPQRLPKRLCFCMDVSGSMYRFDSTDQRLSRLLETVVLIIEAFAGMDHKFTYSITGHSGDGPLTYFVKFDNPPTTRKQRLKVLQTMYAHAETCSSGDYTIDALKDAVQRVRQTEGDEYFVLGVSDANLSRYGISHHDVGKALLKDPKVNAYIVFIASSGDEAAEMTQALPNNAYFTENTSQLPQMFKSIFSASKVIPD